MEQKYLGELSQHDPLYHLLASEIMPQHFVDIRHPSFRVFKMHSSNNAVYLYEERTCHNRFIGKFFTAQHEKGHDEATKRGHQEFANLNLLRAGGLQSQPHQVIKPLAYKSELNNVLIEEYCGGDSLTKVIQQAIHHNKQHRLYRKLTSLAYFLATMHNTTATGNKVNFETDCNYLLHLVGQAKRRHLIHQHEENHFNYLCYRWREQPKMWEDYQVLAHGDATPSNFIFGSGLNVTAIDLERMRYADRTFDLGRIVGELQHYFLQGSGNRAHAEPFIGHFLWEYCCHFPDRQRAFHSITRRLPFQISVTLLRIARNPWIGREHAIKLIHTAKHTLESL